MRWLGFFFIFLAAAGGGYYASSLLDKRKKQLQSLRRAIVFLSREIDYQLAPLSEAFAQTAQRTEEPWKSFFSELSNTMQRKSGDEKEFHETWNIELKNIEKFHSWKKDLSILEALGQGLGQLDKEMQLAQLKLSAEEIVEAEKDAEEQRQQKGRLYRMLGPCMGILGIILLL